MIEKIYQEQLEYSLDNIDKIINSSGVYIFYKQSNATPHYIGKSIKLKTRIKSHFQAARNIKKEQRITHGINKIICIPTTGEFSALLLESRLIKLLSPIMNRQLRKNKLLWYWCIPSSKSHHIDLRMSFESDYHVNPLCFGLYKTKKQAYDHINKIAQDNLLCKVALGLEKSTGPCFSYQIKKCKGACIQKESLDDHFNRLTNAIAPYKSIIWPFQGNIHIKEGNIIHIINNWKYMGTESHIITNSQFTYDDFKIISRTLLSMYPDLKIED